MIQKLYWNSEICPTFWIWKQLSWKRYQLLLQFNLRVSDLIEQFWICKDISFFSSPSSIPVCKSTGWAVLANSWRDAKREASLKPMCLEVGAPAVAAEVHPHTRSIHSWIYSSKSPKGLEERTGASAGRVATSFLHFQVFSWGQNFSPFQPWWLPSLHLLGSSTWLPKWVLKMPRMSRKARGGWNVGIQEPSLSNPRASRVSAGHAAFHSKVYLRTHSLIHPAKDFWAIYI